MDAKTMRLRKELEILLEQASAVAAELQQAEFGDGTPHYDQIELPAHALGQHFSRMVQVKSTREVATRQAPKAVCPTCQKQCRVTTVSRSVHSLDGPLEVLETVAKCRHCRRSFFPSADRIRT